MSMNDEQRIQKCFLCFLPFLFTFFCYFVKFCSILKILFLSYFIQNFKGKIVRTIHIFIKDYCYTKRSGIFPVGIPNIFLTQLSVDSEVVDNRTGWVFWAPFLLLIYIVFLVNHIQCQLHC